MTGASHSYDPLAREEAVLGPCGTRSRDTRGRSHPETPDPMRTPFELDRDRIVHSTAFRRLEYKTQVFVNHEGDHYRTRLTHTLEVAQIARAVARHLGLNEDLVEAVALSHDLGHPPFGHAGETQLNSLMSGAGGFNHNRHSLRVVTVLERRYPDFPGLNLSWEVREAIAKHGSAAGLDESDEYETALQPSLEAQLADCCDALAYANHDIDDGVRSGYLGIDDLQAVELWRDAEQDVRQRWPAIDRRRLVARTVSRLIREQLIDLVEASSRRIANGKIASPAAARRAPAALIGFSDRMEKRKNELHAFLKERLYLHPGTLKAAEKGKRFIEAVFREYEREPALLPADYQARISADGLKRVICDYIAGMTDRFCNQEYQRLFMPFADASPNP